MYIDVKHIVFLLLIMFFYSCGRKQTVDKKTTLPFFNSSLFTPEWIAKESPDYNKIHTIPDFSLVNQEGKKVTQQFYRGKIYVADFFFVSCPGICPMLVKNMSILQKEFENDKDVFLLSHTVMPTKDSVPVLRQYAKENDIYSEKWNLVTGDKKQIYDLARRSYFADEDFVKTSDEEVLIHTENFVLVDWKGRIRGVYNGTLALDTQRLIRHIKLLKKEKNI